MSFSEKRYKRYFEKANYGKFKNAVYDIVNKLFGFMPSAAFEYKIGMKIKEDNVNLLKEQIVEIIEKIPKNCNVR